MITVRYHSFVSVLSSGDVMTFSPDVIRVNPSRDSAAAKQMWEFVQRAAAAGKPVMVSAAEQTHSVSKVARMLGVPSSTIQRSIDEGTLEATKKGAHWRVSDSQIKRFSDYRRGKLADLVADEFDFNL